MTGYLQLARLGLAALVFFGALLALPLSMAWGASSVLPLEPAHPAGWAQSLEPRLNLYRMGPGLYRSALPKTADWPALQRLGVTTVVNFYQHSDGEWLRDPQVTQVHLPMHTDRVDDSDVIAALRSIREGESRGAVLIHCKHGQNRTGLIAAMYRVIYQGWSKEQALAEMAGAGFGGEDRMGDAERYIRGADVGALRIALESGACSTSPWALCALKAKLTSLVEGV